jgi:hypothetical protein
MFYFHARLPPPSFVNKRAFEALSTVIREKNQGANNSKEKKSICYEENCAKLVWWKGCNRCERCAYMWEYVF